MPLRSSYSIYLVAILAAVVLPLLGACDNAIEPFVEGAENAFVITGFLDTRADTQMVRVSPVRRTQEHADDPDPPPVVTLTHVEAGISRSWEHAPLILGDGTCAHLFFNEQVLEHGAMYRLEVRRNGLSTSAVTRVPADPDILVASADSNVFGEIEHGISWTSEQQPHRILIRYEVASPVTGRQETVALPYEGPVDPVGSRWRMAVPLGSDFRRLSRRMETLYDDSAVILYGIAVEMELLSVEWDDDDAGNIENGRGFFASVATFSEEWQLDEALAEDIGYIIPR